MYAIAHPFVKYMVLKMWIQSRLLLMHYSKIVDN